MSGTAGYLGSLKVSGASSAVVDGGMTLSSGKTYYTTNAAHNVWDPSVPPTFDDNAVPVDAANIEEIDYLMGKVTFAAGYSVTGPITWSGNWLELVDVAFCRAYSINVVRNLLDSTVFGDTHVDREPGLIDVSFTFERLSLGLDDLDPGAGSEVLHDILANGEAKVYQFATDLGSTAECWRGWGMINQQTVNASPDDLVNSSIAGDGTLVGNLTRSVSYGDPTA